MIPHPRAARRVRPQRATRSRVVFRRIQDDGRERVTTEVFTELEPAVTDLPGSWLEKG
jgi:hypothetical protein